MLQGVGSLVDWSLWVSSDSPSISILTSVTAPWFITTDKEDLAYRSEFPFFCTHCATDIWTDWSIGPIQSIESHFIFSGDWNLVGKNHIYTELDTAEPSPSCDGENSKLLCQTQERYVKWRTLNRHNWLKTRMRSHNSLMREKCQFTAQLNPLFWLCQISVLLEIFSQPVGPENWAPCPGVATERSGL